MTGLNLATAPTFKQRRRLCRQAGYGHRARNNWGGGDLPAPFAEGDLLWLPEPYPVDRMRGRRMGQPGWYVVSCGFSIDEGDAWYFRVTRTMVDLSSDRLHVATAARSSWDDDVDWMAPFVLVETSDPDGLAERSRLVDGGWSFASRWERCPTCGTVNRTPDADLIDGKDAEVTT